jgi:hypothetical protein
VLRWLAPASLEAHAGSLMLSIGGPVITSMAAFLLVGLVWPDRAHDDALWGVLDKTWNTGDIR